MRFRAPKPRQRVPHVSLVQLHSLSCRAEHKESAQSPCRQRSEGTREGREWRGGGGGAWKSYSLGHPSGKISLVEIPSSCPCCPTSPQHVKAGIGLSYRSRCRPSSTSRYALLPSVIPVEPCHPKAVSGNMLHNSKTYVYVRICIICMYVCMYIYIYTYAHTYR